MSSPAAPPACNAFQSKPLLASLAVGGGLAALLFVVNLPQVQQALIKAPKKYWADHLSCTDTKDTTKTDSLGRYGIMSDLLISLGVGALATVACVFVWKMGAKSVTCAGK